MNTSTPNRPRAHDVRFDGGLMHVELEDGRVLTTSYDRFPKLVHAKPVQRNRWEIIGHGVGIHWPDLDEDLSTDGLLRDAIRVRNVRRRAG